MPPKTPKSPKSPRKKRIAQMSCCTRHRPRLPMRSTLGGNASSPRQGCPSANVSSANVSSANVSFANVPFAGADIQRKPISNEEDINHREARVFSPRCPATSPIAMWPPPRYPLTSSPQRYNYQAFQNVWSKMS
jgi:hypothetical protein